MTASFKAIATALLVTIAPLAASAQNIGGPGPWDPQLNEGLPAELLDRPYNPGLQVEDAAVGTPVLTFECNASELQHLIGQHIDAIDLNGRVARIFTPTRLVGTTDYLPYRINLTLDENDIVQAVACG